MQAHQLGGVSKESMINAIEHKGFCMTIISSYPQNIKVENTSKRIIK
jgi:hypothetical protein